MDEEDDENAAVPKFQQEGAANESASKNTREATSKRKRETARSAPMLSWMKVPVEIKAGSGVPLSAVKGLHSCLDLALAKGIWLPSHGS